MEKIEEGFLDEFKDLEDPRIERCKLYPMEEILFLTLCGVLSGCDSWNDIEIYGKMKLEFLREYLVYANGIPSDDTLRRFYRALEPKSFQSCFQNWMKRFKIEKKGVIAIDGKTSRRTFDNDKKALHLVSAFASESRLVLAQEKVIDKSNEIQAIKEILEWLDVRGSLVSIDAMGCQKEIAKKIKDKKGDYLLALKGNQGTLHNDIKIFFESEIIDKFSAYTIDKYESIDKGHGRIEKRKCFVCKEIDWLISNHNDWSALSTIICIQSERDIKDSVTKETRYYISSKIENAETFLGAIRNHWTIENSLHWVLDMSFGDDQSRVRKDNAPMNMAILKQITLNMIRNIKGKRESIRGKRKQAGWDNNVLRYIIDSSL